MEAQKKTAILDNKSLGNVISEIKDNIATGCTLSVVSALFSLYAYDELNKAAFNRQVELNTQIKKFELEQRQLAGKL